MWPLLLALSAGAGEPTCDQGADRYLTCMGELLGPVVVPTLEARRSEGVEACEQDPPTQSMYRRCLPLDTCGDFLSCLEETARQGEAPVPVQGSRAAQCAHQVQGGRQSIALQIVLTEREGPEVEEGRACVLADRPPQQCLTDEEQALLDAYAAQRQADCEAWPEPLAACVLSLPTAADCDPDAYPLWRLPVASGPPGPPVLWTAELEPFPYDPPAMAWGPDGLLLTLDASGLRGWQGGAEVYRVDADGREMHLLEDAAVAVRLGEGLALYRQGDGRPRGTALPETEVVALGAPGLLAEDGTLYAVHPRRCKRGPRRCLVRVATVPEALLGYHMTLASLGDRLVLGDLDGMVGLDGAGQVLFDLDFGATGADHLEPLPPRHVAVETPGGVVLVDGAQCAGEATLREADCVVGRAGAGIGAWQRPVAGPDGVAFNDHGIVERTHLLSADRSWSVKTGGFGTVAVDDDHVYTVSLGLDGEGPARLVALALADGAPRWSTELPGAALEHETYDAVEVAVRRPWIAARVGERLYVIRADDR